MAAQHICVLANRHNAQVLFIDLLLVPFLVIAIDCWSLRVALCVHFSCHSLFPDDFIHCLPALLSCLSNLQILGSPSFGRSLRNTGTDQAKTFQLWRAEHRMAPSSMGWKWERRTPLWLLGQPDSPLGKGSGGERVTANTPKCPHCTFGVSTRIAHWTPQLAACSCPRALCRPGWNRSCSSCCLFPPQLGENAPSLSAQPKNPDGSTKITYVSYSTPLQLPLRALSTPAVPINSLLKAQKSEVLSSWSSEIIPAMFLIHSLHSKLHPACTDV